MTHAARARRPARASGAGWPWLAALLALLWGAPAHAQQSSFDDFKNLGQLEDRRREPSPLYVGGHELEPSLNLKLFDVTTPHVFGAASVGYVDNLLRTDRELPGTHRVAEPYSSFEAGARLDTELGDHRLELEYRSAATEYWNTGEFDTQQHSASARLDVYAVDFEGHVDASWRRLAYPQTIQLVGLVRLDEYTVRPWLDGRVWRLGLRVGGSWARLDFRQPGLDQLDQRHYRGDVQTYFRVTPKLRAVLEYNYFVVEFDEGRRGALNDYVAHQVRGGIDGTITPKISVSLKAGYNVQDVDKRAFRDRREFAGFVAEMSAGYELFSETRLQLAYSRTLDVSVQGNVLASDQLHLGIDQGLFSTVHVTAHTRYTHAEVSRRDRTLAHLNRFEAGAGAAWRPREWLSLRVGYTFARLGSAFPNSDYEAHEVVASVGVGL